MYTMATMAMRMPTMTMSPMIESQMMAVVWVIPVVASVCISILISSGLQIGGVAIEQHQGHVRLEGIFQSRVQLEYECVVA